MGWEGIRGRFVMCISSGGRCYVDLRVNVLG